MTTRRKTLRTLLAVSTIGAVPAVGAELSDLELTDPIAVALGYQHDADRVDIIRFPKRATVSGQNQFCDNCALYAEAAPGKGTCTAIRGKLVAGKGWCNAWVGVPE